MNWPYAHLVLNHVPVLGTLFVFLLLLTGAWRKSEELLRLSLWWFVALTVVSIPIKFTGDFAFEALGKEPWVDQAVAKRHEESADQATAGVFVLGIAAATGLFLGKRKGAIPRWAVVTTAILALATFALMARTAYSGGQLRHTEVHAR
ncbi:MAG: hypothetical protein AB1705_26445 [Verrucomicrobiota bacterium]